MYKSAKIIFAVILAAALFMCTACSPAKEPAQQTEPEVQTAKEPATQPEINEVLNRKFDDIFEQANFEGTIIFCEENAVSYERISGYANEQKKIENTRNTRYYIGSITKQFTAAAIMLLQERGQLSTKDTLSSYFPEFEYGKQVTIQQLLNMSSGIEDYLQGAENEEKVRRVIQGLSATDGENNKEKILEYIFSNELQFEPGTSYEYSNSSYLLLGEIIEQASQTDYETFIKENIFEPLNMTQSSFVTDDEAAVGIGESDSRDWELYPGVAQPAGGIISTVDDLRKWIHGFTTGEILSKESMDEMLTDYGDNYGYGMMVSLIGYAHTGSVGKYVSCMAFTPNGEYSCIALSNYAVSQPTQMVYELLKEALQSNLY